MKSDTDPVEDAKKALYDGLKILDPGAIRKLSDQLAQSIKSIHSIYPLSKEDIEELRNDAIVVTLKKISEGDFLFQGYHPVAYALTIYKGLLSNYLRKKKLPITGLENTEIVSDVNLELYFMQKEVEMAIGSMLKHLGQNCEKVIRLKYYENLRDQAVIDKNLTSYTTVDSLKAKRAQCLKKLADLMKTKGYTFYSFFNT